MLYHRRCDTAFMTDENCLHLFIKLLFLAIFIFFIRFIAVAKENVKALILMFIFILGLWQYLPKFIYFFLNLKCFKEPWIFQTLYTHD